MKIRQIISIVALLFSVGLWAQTKDRALYRFDNKVLFLSEVRGQILQLEKFRCLNKSWKSLELTKLTKKEYPRLPLLPLGKKALNEEREFILRYINLQKLKTFAKDQLVKIDPKELKKINKRSCFPKGQASWSKEVQDLVKLEYYIKSRYKKDPKKPAEYQERLESFFSTIIRKSNNVLFF